MSTDRLVNTRKKRSAGAFLGVALGVLLAAAPASAAVATPFGVNLVKNPGAEAGPAGNGYDVVSIPHWETFANATVAKYSLMGFLSKVEGNRINGGHQFFSAGIYDTGLGTCGDLQQTIFLKGIGSAIDNGHVRVSFKARVGTGFDADVAHADLNFRTADNHPVAFNGILRTKTGTSASLLAVKGSHILPRHTRLVRVHLWADNVTESYCNAFFDNISVVISHV